MKFFHGEKQSDPYFEGWYLKHQSKDGRLIAITVHNLRNMGNIFTWGKR